MWLRPASTISPHCSKVSSAVWTGARLRSRLRAIVFAISDLPDGSRPPRICRSRPAASRAESGRASCCAIRGSFIWTFLELGRASLEIVALHRVLFDILPIVVDTQSCLNGKVFSIRVISRKIVLWDWASGEFSHSLGGKQTLAISQSTTASPYSRPSPPPVGVMTTTASPA